MMNTFESNHHDNFRDILNMEDLKLSTRHILKQIIDKEGFTTYKVTLKDFSTNGGNYFGILQTVTIKGSSGDNQKEINIFLKNIVPISDTNFIVDVALMYHREGFYYREVGKLYNEIQDKYKIPHEERFNIVKTFGQTVDGLIVLEDIAKAGFKSFDRFQTVSLDFAEQSLKQLAKFHALSFVLKKENSKYFDVKITSLRTLFNFNEDFQSLIKRIFDFAMETLKVDAKTKLEKYYPKSMEKFSKYVNVPTDEAVCLVHGDCRANNILFKDTDMECSKVMLVDYQLMYYGSPVLDFLYFIFTGTDQKFRKRHLDYLKDLYYSTFKDFLIQFDIDAENVYSRKQFEEEYRKKLDYGMMCFLITMPFIFAKTDDVPEMDHGLAEVSFNMEECYKDRLHGVVDDFIQWGYL